TVAITAVISAVAGQRCRRGFRIYNGNGSALLLTRRALGLQVGMSALCSDGYLRLRCAYVGVWGCAVADRVALVETRRICQLTGDRDPQDWPMMNLTAAWNVIGVDEGPTTEHDGRLYIFFGDVAVSDNGGHHQLGWNFILPNNMQGATDSTGQPDWRF